MTDEDMRNRCTECGHYHVGDCRECAALGIVCLCCENCGRQGEAESQCENCGITGCSKCKPSCCGDLLIAVKTLKRIAEYSTPAAREARAALEEIKQQ